MASLSYHVEVSQTPGRFKCWTLHQWQEHPSQCDSGQGQASKVSVFSSSWRAGCSLNFSTRVSENVSTKNCVYDKCDQIYGPRSPPLLIYFSNTLGRLADTRPLTSLWRTERSLLRKSSVTLDWRRQSKAQGWPTDERSQIYPKSVWKGSHMLLGFVEATNKIGNLWK